MLSIYWSLERAFLAGGGTQEEPDEKLPAWDEAGSLVFMKFATYHLNSFTTQFFGAFPMLM